MNCLQIRHAELQADLADEAGLLRRRIDTDNLPVRLHRCDHNARQATAATRIEHTQRFARRVSPQRRHDRETVEQMPAPY